MIVGHLATGRVQLSNVAAARIAIEGPSVARPAGASSGVEAGGCSTD